MSVAGASGLANGTSLLTVTVDFNKSATTPHTCQLVVAANTTLVRVAVSSDPALDRVKVALAAGRAAMVTFSAKVAATHASVVSRIKTSRLPPELQIFRIASTSPSPMPVTRELQS